MSPPRNAVPSEVVTKLIQVKGTNSPEYSLNRERPSERTVLSTSFDQTQMVGELIERAPKSLFKAA